MLSWFIQMVRKRLAQYDSKMDEMYQKAAGKRAQICSLSIQEARERAEALLSDPERFREEDVVIAETKDDPRLDGLGHTVRQFFEQYAQVVHFAHVLSRADIRPCEELRRPGELPVSPDELAGFLRIGDDTEKHAVVVVRPGEDIVYWVSGDDPTEHLLKNSYPSIYHYLLYWFQ